MLSVGFGNHKKLTKLMSCLSDNGLTNRFIEYLEGLKNAEALQEKLIGSIYENISTESSAIEEMYWTNVYETPFQQISVHPDLKIDKECRYRFVEYLKRGVELYDRIIKIVRSKVNSFTSTHAAHTMVTSTDRLYLECASRSFIYIGHLYYFMLNTDPSFNYFKQARDSYIRAFIIDPSSDNALGDLAKLYSYTSNQFSAFFYYFKGTYGVSISQTCSKPLDTMLETCNLNIIDDGLTDIQKMKNQLILVLQKLYNKDTVLIDQNLYEKLQSLITEVIVSNIADSTFSLEEVGTIEDGKLIVESSLDTIVTMVFTILLIGLDRLRKIDSQRFLYVLKLYSTVFFKLLEMIYNYVNNLLMIDAVKDLEAGSKNIDSSSIDSKILKNHELLPDSIDLDTSKSKSSQFLSDEDSTHSSLKSASSNDDEKSLSTCESEDEQSKPIKIILNFDENDVPMDKLQPGRRRVRQPLHADESAAAKLPEICSEKKPMDFRYCFLKVIKLTIDWLRCFPDATDLILETTGINILDEIKKVVNLLPVPSEFASLANKDHLSPEDLLCLGHPLFSKLHKNLDFNFDTFISLEALYDKDDLHRIAYLKKVSNTARIFKNGYSTSKAYSSTNDRYGNGRARIRYNKRSIPRKNFRDNNNKKIYDNRNNSVDSLSNDIGKISFKEKGMFQVSDSMKKIINQRSNNFNDNNIAGRVNVILSYGAIFETTLIRQMIWSKRFRVYVPIVVINILDDEKHTNAEAKRVSRFLYENCYPKYVGFRVQSYNEAVALPKTPPPSACNGKTFEYLDALFQTALYHQSFSEHNESSLILMSIDEHIELFGHNDPNYASTVAQICHRKSLLEAFALKNIPLMTLSEFKGKYLYN